MGAGNDPHGLSLIRGTPSGPVEGMQVGGVQRFLGIPYAAAPVGVNRFALPTLPEPWTDPLPATAHGPTAWQLPYTGALARLLPTKDIPGDGCLNVNVYAPDKHSPVPRPVLVWIHGGSLQHGANSLEGYDGTAFARDAVVFVAANYRLGAEGFSVLEDAPLNLGLADVIAALEWVKANIASFGGDPGQVTVMGHSAGGSLVAALLAHPRAASLVSRAIIQSAPLSAQPVNRARRMTQKIATDLGIGATREEFAARTPAELLASLQRVSTGAGPLEGGSSHALAIDGQLVPEDPLAAMLAGAGKQVPLLIGTTSEEARLWLVPSGRAEKITKVHLALARRKARIPHAAQKLFARNRPGAGPGELLGALATDKLLRVPMYKLADTRHYAGAQTQVYEFAWHSPVEELGAAHGTELPFVFDNLATADAIGLVGTAAPQSLASAMHEAWVCFATMGIAEWPTWDMRRPVKTFNGLANKVVLSPREDEADSLG
ncbi:carboxylesterase/lipase family protein [Arthrobacter sp. AQ5-05]|uniref:carboxylesterase/lipase family protein n=1 Tax=Arthrobacter sp. AQ5-05 TaxID=2184581 RepID=UPI000DCBE9C1|nr:carboxylesterase family protein [Arthrobacter sp. AQ5-05]RAX50203.1 carboxylesterase/lipase family protein [Arthrobacter sp. AQ5-05]